ncbi:DUF916 and DUF3324 domain-containing protein [Carnobacterium gallinarum]|uniref:DUF916 and DUF3324 domain-containing protein n=1 Tax=Carnobacterium gallinarum TaxID=2749 RepID=UPI000552D6C9|nr:DUF916 and DUF3324 domain-containing protein [Carnobacterium gallinarum]
MKKSKIFSILFTIMVLLTTYLPQKAYAANEDSSVPISANVVLPENQYKKEASYFYLKMTPGQEQELEVKLNNGSDKAQTVDISLASGITNDGGIIDYPDDLKKFDKTLKYPFSKIASTDKTATIDPNSTKSIFIKVKMPAEEYDGMIIGGINISLKENNDKEKADKDSEGGMKIKNVIRYNFGIVLIENENVVIPDMKLNKAYAGQVMGINTIKANLSNTESWIIDNLDITAKVSKKGSKEVLYETTKNGLRMAPNSNFDFGIGMGNKAYKAGSYKVTIAAKSDSPEKEWNFEKEFTIDSETAKKLNDKAAELEAPDYTMYWIIGGVSLGALLIVVIVTLVIYKKKKKAREKEERRKRLMRKKKRQAQNKKRAATNSADKSVKRKTNSTKKE